MAATVYLIHNFLYARLRNHFSTLATSMYVVLPDVSAEFQFCVVMFPVGHAQAICAMADLNPTCLAASDQPVLCWRALLQNKMCTSGLPMPAWRGQGPAKDGGSRLAHCAAGCGCTQAESRDTMQHPHENTRTILSKVG